MSLSTSLPPPPPQSLIRLAPSEITQPPSPKGEQVLKEKPPPPIEPFTAALDENSNPDDARSQCATNSDPSVTPLRSNRPDVCDDAVLLREVSADESVRPGKRFRRVDEGGG